MEIVHRVGIHADPGIVAEIRGLGVVPEVGPLIASFDASESAPNWRRVDAWIRRRRPSDIVSTRFDDAEIEAARWLEPAITQHRGFPQPRDGDFGYRELTFDVADYCTTCGIGLRQVSPFQMKGDPNWGRRGVLQMHWVYDVFFARPDVWRDVFEPFGIGKRSVMKPSGTVLESVVQVTVDETVPVDVEGLSPLVCPLCGRAKYEHVVRGRSPRPLVAPHSHIVWSQELFGSGAAAGHEVLMSGELVAAMRMAGVRGLTFRVAS